MKKSFRRLMAAAGVIALSSALMVTAAGQASASVIPACGNNSLVVTHNPGDGGAGGHTGFTLLFRNVSHKTCTLTGYPGFSTFDAHGHKIADAARELGGYLGPSNFHVSVVFVKPGQFAFALVQWVDVSITDSGGCPVSASAAVTPPNTTKTVHFTAAVGYCYLQTSPVQPGTFGDSAFAKAQILWQQGAAVGPAHRVSVWRYLDAFMARTFAQPLVGANGDPVALVHAIAVLHDVRRTPAQNAVYLHDIRTLNSYFGTQTLYR